MKIDVLCVGNASYDLVFSLKSHPSADEKTIAENFHECGGGPAANAAVTVSRLGLKSAFAGYLGNDHFGDRIIEEFKNNGVNSSLVIRDRYQTPLSSILVKPSGDRTVVHFRGNPEPLPRGSINLDQVHTKLILFDGHEPLISPALAQTARAKGIRTMLDAGSVHSGTTELMDKVDYLVCSETFAADYTQQKNPSEAAQALAEICPNVIITLGNRGLFWHWAGHEGALPAFDVHVVDTNGAGDAFHGAFASAMVRNRPLESALQFASAVAALTCTKTGGRPGIPTKSKVEEFLHKIS